MQPVVCPFQALYDIMCTLKNEIGLDDKIIIVDFLCKMYDDSNKDTYRD